MNSCGEVSWDLIIFEWGCYLVRVCDEESGYCVGDYFYVGYFWYGDED